MHKVYNPKTKLDTREYTKVGQTKEEHREETDGGNVLIVL